MNFVSRGGVLILLSLAFSFCGRSFDAGDLKTGDILFAGHGLSIPGELSQAINEVTRTSLETNYTHMGIVEITDGEIYVIHSEPEKGVYREALAGFLERYAIVDAYRLSEEFTPYIPPAMVMANNLLGTPYDHTFIIGSGAHYCSGLIYTLFKEANVFQLEPMTFKDPATGEFHQGWVDHYARLGIAIPEGLPGCNPNGMAASGSITKIGTIKK